MLNAGQICVLVIVTEVLVYCFLIKVLETIKHCSTSKTYREGLKKGMIAKDDAFFESFNKKEEETK